MGGPGVIVTLLGIPLALRAFSCWLTVYEHRTLIIVNLR